MDYEVVIVGGGPSGLIAARDIAKKGISVCVVEKSPEIGYPVKCSGLFSVAGLKDIDAVPDDSLICSTIRGGRFHSPGGRDFLAYSKQDRAYVVERKMFDKFLAKEAIRAGAEVKLKTRALDLKRNSGITLKISEMGHERTVKCGLLIGADGAGSIVSKWAGIERSTKFVSALQIEVARAGIEDDVAEVYFGKNYAPGFYAWILPKGDVYEVGVGTKGGVGTTPRELLKRFITRHPIASPKIDTKSVLEFNKGAIPVGGPKKTVSERIMLVGDSAGQTKASTGGGVITGGICARIAADSAISAVEEDDFTEGFLAETYEKSWRKELEREFLAHQFLKTVLDSASDTELDSLFDIITAEGIPELMTSYTDTDRPLDFVKKVMRNDNVLTWAQRFLDLRKDFLA